jgi:hypothetical protein
VGKYCCNSASLERKYFNFYGKRITFLLYVHCHLVYLINLGLRINHSLSCKDALVKLSEWPDSRDKAVDIYNVRIHAGDIGNGIPELWRGSTDEGLWSKVSDGGAAVGWEGGVLSEALDHVVVANGRWARLELDGGIAHAAVGDVWLLDGGQETLRRAVASYSRVTRLSSIHALVDLSKGSRGSDEAVDRFGNDSSHVGHNVSILGERVVDRDSGRGERRVWSIDSVARVGWKDSILGEALNDVVAWQRRWSRLELDGGVSWTALGNIWLLDGQQKSAFAVLLNCNRESSRFQR